MPASSKMSSMQPHKPESKNFGRVGEKKVNNSSYLVFCVWDAIHTNFSSSLKSIKQNKICACLTYFQAHKQESSKIEVLLIKSDL